MKFDAQNLSRAALIALAFMGLWIGPAWAVGNISDSPPAVQGLPAPRPCEFPGGTGTAGSPDDLFVCNTHTGEYAIIGNGPGSDGSSLSADGRYEVFEALAPDSVNQDRNGVIGIFLKDLTTGTVRQASVASDGAAVNGDSNSPALSGDGSFVAFRSAASNLVSGDDNGRGDLFIHDPASGLTVRIGGALGEPPYGQMSFMPAYTPDGVFLAVRRDGLDTLAAWLRNHPDASTFTRDSDIESLAAAPAILAAAASEADVSVVLEAETDVSPARVGQKLHYRFRVENLGPAPATNLTLVLKPGAAKVVALPNECNALAEEIRCALGTLPSQAFGTSLVTVHPTETGTLTGTASISAAETDPNTSNNSATVTKEIQAALADLGVSLATQPGTGRVGVDLLYSYTVINNGPSEATHSSFTATLGDVAVKELVSGCSQTGHQITCDLGTVPVQSTSPPRVFAKVRPNSAGSLANTATVSSQATEADSANNSFSLNTTVDPASADLRAVLTASPGIVRVGDTFDYGFSVTNAGPSAVTNPRFELDIQNVAFVTIPAGCTAAGSHVQCPLGPMEAGDSRQASITVRPTAAGNLEGTGTAVPTSQQEADPAPANNTAKALKAIDPASAVLNLTLTPAAGTVRSGDVVRYDFSIANNGPSIATGVTLSGVMAGPWGELSVPAGCTVSGNTFQCAIASIAVGGTPVTGTFSVRAAAAGTLAATLTAKSAETVPAGYAATAAKAIEPASAVLNVILTPPSETVRSGDVVRYDFSIANNGPSIATGVTLSGVMAGPWAELNVPAGCTVSGNTFQRLFGNSGGWR